MKTGVVCSPNIASETLEKSIMPMSKRGSEMAAYFMRDRIYTDKMLAVIREYICNALDEHKKYNINVPIQVKLKKAGNSYVWSVRDFALGLNDHDVRNVFGGYFESTKDRENISIGGFGIGSKAGFSYTDTFYVTSYHNGLKTDYIFILGGGSNGVPVGEIYRVSQTPTTEQGIEVSLEVTNDYCLFNNKTQDFVKQLTIDSNIEFESCIETDIFVPIAPVYSETRNGFVFNTYEHKSLGNIFIPSAREYCIRMGGVIYTTKERLPHDRYTHSTIVVDVPIGKLSLAITREGIENTPANREVISNIVKELESLYEEDAAALAISKPKLIEYMANPRKYKDNTSKGKFFQLNFADIYPNVDKVYRWICTTHYNREHLCKDGAVLVFIFPSIKNTSDWHKRLSSSLTDLAKSKSEIYEGYLYIDEQQYSILESSGVFDTLDMTGIKFVKVKQLGLGKLPKIPRDKSKYLVYFGHGTRNSKSHNEESLEEWANCYYPIDWDTIDYNWWEKDDLTLTQLHYRTISVVDEFGTCATFPTVNSSKFAENMVENQNWLSPKSTEYKNAVSRITEREAKRKKLEQCKTSLESTAFGRVLSSRVVEHILKHPEKLDTRVNKLWKKLVAEPSFRGRVFFSMNNQYSWDRPKFSREELRKLLKLK